MTSFIWFASNTTQRTRAWGDWKC